MSVIDQLEHYQSDTLIAVQGRDGSRSKAITHVSKVGIATNIALVAVKLAIGLATHSIAVISDAMNNLSDALSSLLIILGAKLANRPPDREHPYGYGRVEYIATVAIGALILFGGSNTLHEAIEGIRSPRAASYDMTSLTIMVIATVTKMVLGLYYKRRGRALNSDSLVASGTEALFDVAVTASTIVSAVISMVWQVSTEAYVAVGISLLILKTGIEILLQAFSRILGQRVEAEVSAKVKAAVANIKGVEGTCDWRLLDFGPENIRGSAYVEVDERLSAAQADRVARAAQLVAYESCGIRLDAVGITAVSCADEETRELRRRVEELALAHEHVIDVCRFRVNSKTGLVTYDVVVDFEVENREAFSEELASEAAAVLPGYRFFVTTDSYIID